jgi:hypothetical protein
MLHLVVPATSGVRPWVDKGGGRVAEGRYANVSGMAKP